MHAANKNDVVPTLQTWANTREKEDYMTDEHLDMWRIMIANTEEHNLRNRTILDFGSSQGGFLRALYYNRPYKAALGVDIAADSVARANQFRGGIPAQYAAPEALADHLGSFDIAYSHEVVYLMQDLRAHAAQLFAALRPGGIYYAATGCHEDNPLWAEWHGIAKGLSNTPVPSYRLQDYHDAFDEAGFDVELKPFAPPGFVRLNAKKETYYPSVADKVRYFQQSKMLFRFSKRD